MNFAITIRPEWEPKTPASRLPNPVQAQLTDEHSASSYGIPVVVLPESGCAFGPADIAGLASPNEFTGLYQLYNGPIKAVLVVPNPGPGWEPDGYEAFLSLCASAGWRIQREQW